MELWEQVPEDHEMDSSCYLWPSPVAHVTCVSVDPGGAARRCPGKLQWGSGTWAHSSRALRSSAPRFKARMDSYQIRPLRRGTLLCIFSSESIA